MEKNVQGTRAARAEDRIGHPLRDESPAILPKKSEKTIIVATGRRMAQAAPSAVWR